MRKAKFVPPEIAEVGFDFDWDNKKLWTIDLPTECLYYLHDNTRTIHCAKTLVEHEVNIEKCFR